MTKRLSGEVVASKDEQASEQARRRRQEAFLKEVAETKKLARAVLDRLNRLEEIATSGQTSTRALVVEFRQHWSAKMGQEYFGHEAVDHGTMRRLLKQYSAADLRFRMPRYFEMREPFVVRSSYSLTVFGQVVAQLGRAADGVHGDVDVLRAAGWYEEGESPDDER